MCLLRANSQVRPTRTAPRGVEGGQVPGHDIIVVGASAGGVEALTTLFAGLPADLPAAVFVVLHIPAQARSLLPEILTRAGQLPAAQAVDGMVIEHGKVYVAPADHHLLVEPGRVRVVHGPHENRHRPAVDPLFRSAAAAYGPRVVGVILSGTLDDGTSGLAAVKAAGGVAIVQDPQDALYRGMPDNALRYVKVDYCLPCADIPPLLTRLAATPVTQEGGPVSDRLEHDVEAARLDSEALAGDERPGKPSVYVCPDCSGTLWEVHEDNIVRFRCRVGHAYTLESLLAAHDEALETSLWVALRALEESISLNRRLEERSREAGLDAASRRFGERVAETEVHAQRIREMLLGLRADIEGEARTA